MRDKDNIENNGESKTSTEILIALSEIELSLAVAKAKAALVDSEEDEDYGYEAIDLSFLAGAAFYDVIEELACCLYYFKLNLRTKNIQELINDIETFISTMPQYLHYAFKDGQNNASY